jgi:hypothetical protein
MPTCEPSRSELAIYVADEDDDDADDDGRRATTTRTTRV